MKGNEKKTTHRTYKGRRPYFLSHTFSLSPPSISVALLNFYDDAVISRHADTIRYTMFSISIAFLHKTCPQNGGYPLRKMKKIKNAGRNAEWNRSLFRKISAFVSQNHIENKISSELPRIYETIILINHTK